MQLQFVLDSKGEELVIETKEQQLEREIRELRNSVSSIRKGLFARQGELQKKYVEIKLEFETLCSALCKFKEHGKYEKNPSSDSNDRDIFIPFP